MKKQEYKKIKFEIMKIRKQQNKKIRILRNKKIQKFEDGKRIVSLDVIKCMYYGVRACSRTDCL